MHRPYGRLLLMALLSFASMYVLMYAMVDRASNALPNLNQAYMAGLVTAPMVCIEVLFDGRYPDGNPAVGFTSVRGRNLFRSSGDPANRTEASQAGAVLESGRSAERE
jgi:hypothetical protein